MNNNDRYILLSKLEEMSELKLGDGSKITKLDYLIYTDYRCGHEYGICHKISGDELLCNCLDCGNALDEIHYREIYDISDNMDFRAIRRDYLNYQRNSYTLWESALKTYNDDETKFVFNPKMCLEKSFDEVQYALTKYRVALQKQKQTEIWLTLCNTFVELFDGDIRIIFDKMNNDVDKIRNFIQKENKRKFPYLSGTKICNYWMFVIYQYTDRKYKNVEHLTVAPDTHVCKATHRLGLITDEEFNSSNVQQLVIDRWQEFLKNTKYKPIDIHTQLWLWSRNGFKDIK